MCAFYVCDRASGDVVVVVVVGWWWMCGDGIMVIWPIGVVVR
jgi:hypothetical protein